MRIRKNAADAEAVSVGGAVQEECGAEKADNISVGGSSPAEGGEAATQWLYRKLLRQAGISERGAEAILRVTDADALALDNEEAALAAIRHEWGGLIEQRGDATAHPAGGTAEEIYSMAQMRGMTARQINENWGAVLRSIKKI